MKDCLALILVPALASGWWYLLVVPRASLVGPGAHTAPLSLLWSSLLHGTATEHFRFAIGSDQAHWENRWHFYLAKLPVELGWWGIALAAGGMCVAAVLFWNRRARAASDGTVRGPDARVLWPLFVLLPALLLLSSLRSKVPWIVIALFPAWATLQALALAAIVAFAQQCLQRKAFGWFGGQASWIRAVTNGMAGCAVAVAVYTGHSRDYETMLRSVDESQWRGADYSKEAADALNRLAHDGERALITSFHYWKGLAPGRPCPIFAYYFVRRVDVLLRPHDRSFLDLVGDIKEHRLDWALLSPDPGPAEFELFGAFEQKLGLKPHRLRQAFLFRTSSLYRDLPATAGAPSNANPSKNE